MGAVKKTPRLQHTSVTQLPDNTNCMACSEDDRYLCLGHSQGLSVWYASTLVKVAEWVLEILEITSVQMTRVEESIYLLGTVDDMGVARIFAHHNDVIHLLIILNAMEDINYRSICLTFELSEGGHYGTTSVSCCGSSWLDVYQFPIAAWLKELEMVLPHGQDPESIGEVDVKWSSVCPTIKTKPLKSFTVKPLDGQPDISQTSSFLSHCLTLDIIRSSSYRREMPSFNPEKEKTKESQITRGCTHHFLLTCGQLPSDNKADVQTESPVAVAVWWQGSHNLLHYLLQKPAKHNKADVEPMPDVVWPNANEILCSAVSQSTRYVALGHSDALVCVWDRLSGAPLKVVLVPESRNSFSRVQFVEYWPMTADESQTFSTEKVNLLISCKNGTIHSVTTGRGTQSCTLRLTERPRYSRDVPGIIMSVPFMQSLSLVVHMSGKMFLHDIINNRTVCFLTPPSSHLITTPCNPVCTLNTKQQTLFIRGDQDNGCQSHLFSFNFGESDFLKQYLGQLPDSPQQKAALTDTTVEEACNHYLQQRALCVEDRNKEVRRSWQQLQETAAISPQGYHNVNQQRNSSK